MNTYTAKQMEEILQQEGKTEITLRKIRYYAQAKVLPAQELVDGKLVYTDTHLDSLRALCTLKQTNQSLEQIKTSLKHDNINSWRSLAKTESSYSVLQDLSNNIMEKQIEMVNEDISIVFSNGIDSSIKQEILDSIVSIYTKHKGEK